MIQVGQKGKWNGHWTGPEAEWVAWPVVYNVEAWTSVCMGASEDHGQA